MRGIIYGFAVLFCISTATAQVGIGTTSPRGALEISNTTNGGVVIPSYALSGNNDDTTVTNPQGGGPVIGTIVYNTNPVTGINAIDSGFVYWNGNVWAEISITPGTPVYGEIFRNSDVNNIALNTAIVFDTNGPASGTTLNNNGIVTGAAGVYRITYTVSMEQLGSASSQEVEFFLQRGTTEIPGSRVYLDVSNNPDYITATRSILVNLTSANQTIGVYPDQTNNSVIILSGTSLSVELID